VKHAHRRHGTRSGRSAAGLVAIVVLVGGTIATLAVSRAAPAAGAETSAGGADAARLYLANCATCHGPRGEGTDAGVPLVGVGAASVDFYLRTGRMPLGAPGQRPHRQAPRFDDADIRALVDYVAGFGAGPAIPAVGTSDDVQRGWRLYTANCAACHAATGAGNAVGGGFVAVGLGNATNLEIAEAMLIGPGAMPRFAFGQEDQDAIIAYVEYLRSSPAPGGAPIGGLGPVAEGFVAVVIGLTALVLVAVFVGRRSHAGEPAGPGEEALS
jgi:ubiquinol-cytochrome c reductase cytochrome c subunit